MHALSRLWVSLGLSLTFFLSVYSVLPLLGQLEPRDPFLAFSSCQVTIAGCFCLHHPRIPGTLSCHIEILCVVRMDSLKTAFSAVDSLEILCSRSSELASWPRVPRDYWYLTPSNWHFDHHSHLCGTKSQLVTGPWPFISRAGDHQFRWSHFQIAKPFKQGLVDWVRPMATRLVEWPLCTFWTAGQASSTRPWGVWCAQDLCYATF